MVFEVLREMIVESLGCDESVVTLGSELRDELGLSDGQLMEIMDAMSSELGFRAEEIAPDEIETVGELVKKIAGLL